ncbi:MAG: helix-turn-helix domain-containing protein [Thermoleophilaceae bacterium]
MNGPSRSARDALTREDILSAAEVAELLQLRRSTVEDYARRGLLPSIKLGRFRRFVRADVEAELTRLRNGGSPSYPGPVYSRRRPAPRGLGDAEPWRWRRGWGRRLRMETRVRLSLPRSAPSATRDAGHGADRLRFQDRCDDAEAAVVAAPMHLNRLAQALDRFVERVA